MRKTEIFAFFFAVLIVCSTSYFCLAGKGQMDVQQIKAHLIKLNEKEKKIEYLEELSTQEKNHFVIYTLASLYIETERPEKAEMLLKLDLKTVKDAFAAYESSCLLLGVYIDQEKEIPQDEIDRSTRIFQKMKKKAKRMGAVQEGYPDSGEERGAMYDLNEIKPVELGSLDEQRKAKAYVKDPFQFERMIGDYYYHRREYEKAFTYYHNFYQDMDKPIQVFIPESMRNYTELLLKKVKTDEALLFMGYIINLRPYMLDDIFDFATLYYTMGDRTSALLVLLFAHTLTDGYDARVHLKSRKLIEELYAEIEPLREAQKIVSLTDVYLSSEHLSNLQLIIDGIKKDGIQHFFLYYLEGIHYFAEHRYNEALGRFIEFCQMYPYLADAYYYAMVCMFYLDLERYSDQIITFSERVIELKPASLLKKMTKLYLGKILGIDEKDSEKLLTPSEMGFILRDFLVQDAPLSSLDPLLAALTLPQNPYQIALIQLMSKIEQRKDELVRYMKRVYDLFNENGRRNIEKILSALGEPLD